MVRILPTILDLVVVLVFAVIGRASHSEGLTPMGIAQTGWPFAVACLCGWGVVGLLADHGYGPRASLVIWLVTLLGGMGLRIVAGDTAELPFVIVASLFLLSALFGWRLVARFIRVRPRATA